MYLLPSHLSAPQVIGLPAALNISSCGNILIKQEINAFGIKSSQLGSRCASLKPALLIRLKTSATFETKLLTRILPAPP